MNVVKKSISALLALLMVAVYVTAVGAEQSEPEIEIASVSMPSGETAKVDFRINNNPGIFGINLSVIFDAALTPVTTDVDGVAAVKADNGESFPNSLTGPIKNSSFSFIYVNSQNTDNNSSGVLFSVYFILPQDAATGSEYSISIDSSKTEIINSQADDVVFNFGSGTISVIERPTTTTQTTTATTTATTTQTTTATTTATTTQTTTATTTATTTQTTTATTTATTTQTTRATTTQPTTTQGVTINYGDCNGDGVINSKDVLMLRKQLAGIGSGCVFVNTDVNSDGVINTKDLLLLRRHIAGFSVAPWNTL